MCCGVLGTLLSAAHPCRADYVLSDFNGTGFNYTFEGFNQTTNANSVRLLDPVDSWGGAGLGNSFDFTPYADGRFTVDVVPNAGNQADMFTLELIDTSGRTGKWSFHVSGLPTSSFSNLVSATTLANPTSGVGDYQSLDLGNITTWQVLGEYGGSVPFDMNFDRVAVSSTVPPPPAYPGAEPDAAWRTTAASDIDLYRKGNLSYTVTAGGAPVQGAQIDVQMTEHEFKWGSAVAAWRLASGAGQQTTYKQKVEELFNVATLENALKWPAWEGEFGPIFDQSKAAGALNWLEAQGITGRGHVQVWPGYSNLPSAIQAKIDEYNNPGTTSGRKNQLETELQQDVIAHINEITAAAAGQVDYWDVINEERTNHDLMDILGDQVMVDWFNVTKAADPNAVTYLNEWGILASGGGTNTSKQREYEDTIQFLIDQGAAIEGLGMQGHFDEGSLTGPEQLWTILDRFDDFGLPIQVTEFDINTPDGALQAQYTADAMTAFFAHPAMDAFIMWGFWEDAHWRPDAALYRSDWSIKPNGQAYLDLVFDQWWTDEQSITDGTGAGTVRGFKGRHDVTVTYQGVSQTHHGIVISDTTSNLQLPLASSVDGSLDADVLNTSGTMEVAGIDSIGTLRLTGAFEQLASGTLHIEFTDNDADLIFADSLVLDGTLVIDTLAGLTPDVGDVFVVLLSTGTRTGMFDNVISPNLLLDVQYLNNQVKLTVLEVLALPGDLDGDGFVGLSDIDIVLNNWNQNVPPANPAADPTGDGFVGLDDLDIVLSNWNAGTPPADTYRRIPEPHSLLYFGLLGISLSYRKRSM